MWRVRPWPLTHPGLTTPCPSSLRGFQCAAHMTQATDLSPIPLITILLHSPILSMCTNFPLSVPPPLPTALHSFLHFFHLLLFLLFCLPSCFRVRGRCNAGPNLSLPQPYTALGLETLVCGQTCAWHTRPRGEPRDCLSARQLDCCTKASSGSGVFIGLRKEEMYSLNESYCVWKSALRLFIRQAAETTWIVPL